MTDQAPTPAGRKRRWPIIAASAAGVCAAAAAFGVYRMSARRSTEAVLPVFVEPGPGPRAASSAAFGFVIGSSSLEAVQVALAGAGLDCPDISQTSPEVRLACDPLDSSRLYDADRPPSRGRLLLVFDSPRHPLRHASFQRVYPPEEMATAIADLAATRARMAGRFGGPGGWRFADLHARVTAVDDGSRGLVISEVVEVPWPVRPDAPGRPLARAGL